MRSVLRVYSSFLSRRTFSSSAVISKAMASNSESKAAAAAPAAASRHGVFKDVEASRPDFEKDVKFHMTKTVKPDWEVGSGANSDEWKNHKSVEIDPYGEGRAPTDNYKLLISGIVPRPIGFISSVSADGKSRNLAPFSYTNLIHHDPPVLTVGFSNWMGGKVKDTCNNILETKECVINIISDWFIEAANYTSTNAPPEVSEWDLSGLTPAKSSVVKADRVAESAFSIECTLMAHHELESPVPGPDGKKRKTGHLCIFQGVRFHVREDALNEQKNIIDIGVLKPISRLGGITYGRMTSGFELTRPDFNKEKEENETVAKIAAAAGCK